MHELGLELEKSATDHPESIICICSQRAVLPTEVADTEETWLKMILRLRVKSVIGKGITMSKAYLV